MEHWTFAREIYKLAYSNFNKKREHAKLPNYAFRSKTTRKAITQFRLKFSFLCSKVSIKIKTLEVKMEFNNNIKYSEQLCRLALELVDNGQSIESVAKKLSIPPTTLRNWKHGYTKIYGSFEKFDVEKKQKALDLAFLGGKIKGIAEEIGVNYSTVRLFLKKVLDKDKYERIKLGGYKLPEIARLLTKDVAYIFGVLIGDGYFAD